MKNRTDYILFLLSVIVIIFTINTLYAPHKKQPTAIIPLDAVKQAYPEAQKLVRPRKKRTDSLILISRENKSGRSP